MRQEEQRTREAEDLALRRRVGGGDAGGDKRRNWQHLPVRKPSLTRLTTWNPPEKCPF